MRIEYDANGYVLNTYEGCNSGNCTEYTGKTPSGYDSLIDWATNALINAYYLENGNLILDADREAELIERQEQQTIDNSPVLRKDLFEINEVIEGQYEQKTATGQVIAVDNVKKVSPQVKITNIDCYAFDKINIVTQGKNILRNDAKTETIAGITFTKNTDESITIKGTATEDIEYNLSGSSTNTTSIFVLKKNEDYYLNIGDLNCEMRYYDGTISQVYTGASGVINLPESKEITQVLIKISNGTTIDTTIYPMLEYGTSSSDYEEYKARQLDIDFSKYVDKEYYPVSPLEYDEVNDIYYVEGKCEQETRSGKNLFDKDNATLIANCYITSDKIVGSNASSSGKILRLSCKSNTNYTISKIVSNRFRVFTYNSTDIVGKTMNGAIISDNSTSITIKSGASDIYLYCQYKDSNDTNEQKILDSIQIEEGTEATQYEAYGVSPSPEFPSEIKTVKGIRNLLSFNNLTTQTVNGITITNNQDGSVTFNGTATKDTEIKLSDNTEVIKKGSYFYSLNNSGSITRNFNNFCYGKVGTTQSTINNGTSTTMHVNATKDYDTIYIYIYIYSGTVFTNYTVKPQFEEGSIAHDYVPYGTWAKVKVTGKNLFDKAGNIGKNKNLDTDGNISDNTGLFVGYDYIPVKPNTSYTISTANGNYKRIGQYRKDKTFISRLLSSANATQYTFTTDGNCHFIRIACSITDLDSIQIEESSNATEYEAYKEKEVLIDLNKPNLFDKDNFIETKLFSMANNILGEASALKSFIFDVSNYNTITIQKISGARFGISATVEYPVVGDSVVLLKDYNNNDTSATVDVSEYNYILVGYWTSNGEETLTEQEILNSIKIYEGYSPYHELSSIGDTKDTLSIVNGQVVIDKKIEKVILNGSEEWILWGNGTTSSYRMVLQTFKNIILKSSNILCTHFENKTANDLYDGIDGVAIDNNGYIIIHSDSFTTLADFKTWLSENPVTVYYELEEPEEIKLDSIHTGGTTIDYIEIENGVVYVSHDGIESTLISGNVNLFDGFDTVYTLQDTDIDMTYCINKLDGYSTTEEIESKFIKTEEEIGLEISKKVDTTTYDADMSKKVNNSDYTSAQILAKINGDTSEVKIKADKVKLEGYTTINNGFSVDTSGNMTCNNATMSNAIIQGENSKLNIQTNKTFDDAIVITGLFNGFLPTEIKIGNYISYYRIYDNGSIMYETAISPAQITTSTIRANNIYAGENMVVSSPYVHWLNLVNNGSSNYMELNLYNEFAGKTQFGINMWASDKRLKDNIEDTEYEALEKLKSIKHRQFDYKAGGHVKLGYVADELEEIDKDLIFEVGEEKIKQPAIDKLIPLLSKAIQEQQEQIEKLEKRIKELEEVAK